MKSDKPNAKKISLYYLVGTIFNKGISFITVPIFTRLLSLKDYGIVTTYNSWVAIAGIVMSLALYMAIRASFIDYSDKVNDFASVIVTFTLIYGMLLMVIAVGVTYFIPDFSKYTVLIFLCMLQSLAAALIEEFSMYMMMQYRYKMRTAFMVLPNLVSVLLSIIIIKFVLTGNLYWGKIISGVFITALFGIAAVVMIFKDSKVRFNREYLKYGLKISVPLVMHGIALSILSQSDRTMITSIRNEEETAIYGLVYNFGMIATVLTTALDGVWVPWFTKKMKEKSYSEINIYSKKYVKFMTLAMIGVILVGPEVVKLLATKSYWEGIKIIPPIVLANYLIFLYTMYVNVEHFEKKTVFISINTLIAAISNIALNVFFIKKYGYVGAAYTTLFSYGLSLLMHYLYSRKLHRELFPFRQFVIPMLFIIAVLVVFYLCIDIWVIRWIVALICVAYVVMTEKDTLLKIIKQRG